MSRWARSCSWRSAIDPARSFIIAFFVCTCTPTKITTDYYTLWKQITRRFQQLLHDDSNSKTELLLEVSDRSGQLAHHRLLCLHLHPNANYYRLLHAFVVHYYRLLHAFVVNYQTIWKMIAIVKITTRFCGTLLQITSR